MVIVIYVKSQKTDRQAADGRRQIADSKLHTDCRKYFPTTLYTVKSTSASTVC